MPATQLAKTTRPRTAPLLPRPRLFQRLDQAGAKPLTWVCAHSGAGKTSLVVSYLAARPSRPIWYQVDAGDADAASFFYFLGLAAPKRRQPMPLLTFEARPSLLEFTRTFFRTLFGRFNLPFTLVFDNYQEVAAGSDFHQILPLAIAELPRHGRVICVSRNDPPASFAKLREDQAIELVDNSDLKFTEAETTLLANKLSPDKLPRAKAAEIYRASEGWAAGIVLTVRELGNQASAAAPSARTPQHLFDYLAGEVFKRTEAATQEVLRQTALLPRITSDVAEALTGDLQAGLILANLQRQNFFTTKSTAGTVSYQYHPLFRDFLLAQAKQFYDAETYARLRCKAAQLLEAAGQLDAAAEHYQRLNDWPALAGLICRHARQLLDQGRHQTVEQWVTLIPEPLFEEQPWLRFWRAQSFLGQRHGEKFQDLQQCIKDFREARDYAGVFLTWSALVTFISLAADFDRLKPWLVIIESLIGEAGGFPSEQVEMQVAIAMMGGIEMCEPNHPEAAAWACRARELCRGHLDIEQGAIGAGYCLRFHIRRGELDRAREIADELYATAKRPHVAPLVRLSIAVNLSSYEWLLALPGHRQTIANAIQLSGQIGTPAQITSRLLDLAIQSALHDGDIAPARKGLTELAGELSKLTPAHSCSYYASVIRCCLAEDNIDGALTHVPPMLEGADKTGDPLNQATSLLLAAQVHFRSGESALAAHELQRATEMARRTASLYCEFPCRLTAAQFLLTAKRDSEGIAALRQAMELGAKYRFMSAIVWFPRAMADLCVRALKENIEVDYVCDLIRRHRLMPECPPVEIEIWPWPVKLYTLGRFKILKNDKPRGSGRKAPKRILALLKTIIAHGGNKVGADVLIALLWPSADGDAARAAFIQAVHRLRELLGRDDAITWQENQLSLNERVCWVDAFAVARLLKQNTGDDSIRNTERAQKLYAGPFLSGDPDRPEAALPFADKLRRDLLRSIAKAGNELLLRQAHDQALTFYERGLAIDPCAEELTRRVMAIHNTLGRPNEVEMAYRRLEVALWQQLKKPSEETQRLRRRLVETAAA